MKFAGLLVCMCLVLLSITVQAKDVKVNCHGKGPFTSITAALKTLDPAQLNTVTVNGNCTENVLVEGFDRLTLITKSGATINDASKGVNAVVDIEDSRRVTLQGFTINGGSSGVFCANASVCRVSANTIQSSVGDGLVAAPGSIAYIGDNIIQNNVEGLRISIGSVAVLGGDTIQGNTFAGMSVGAAQLYCYYSTIQNNGNAGVVGQQGAGVRIESCTITGNASDGVQLEGSAEGRFAGSNVITGNGGDGVNVGDLSFAFFEPGNNITGNSSGTDVACNPQFSATRGALTDIGGGTTNCTEPKKQSATPRP